MQCRKVSAYSGFQENTSHIVRKYKAFYTRKATENTQLGLSVGTSHYSEFAAGFGSSIAYNSRSFSSQPVSICGPMRHFSLLSWLLLYDTKWLRILVSLPIHNHVLFHGSRILDIINGESHGEKRRTSRMDWRLVHQILVQNSQSITVVGFIPALISRTERMFRTTGRQGTT